MTEAVDTLISFGIMAVLMLIGVLSSAIYEKIRKLK